MLNGSENILRKETLNGFQLSEKYFDVISDNMSEGVLVIAPDFEIIYVNSMAAILTGIIREKLLGLNFIELFSGADQNEIISRMKGVPQESSPVNSLLITLNNKNIYIGIIPAGKENNCSIIMSDVSEQKRMEILLQRAQKMEAMSVLSGGIAHNFNNLLMGILGNVSLMLLNLDSAYPHYQKLKNIEQYVNSGAGLAKQLLGFTRGDNYEVRHINLNRIVKKQNRMFGHIKKEITICEKYENDLWTVEVDPGQIEQVLLNLYINAWQAMPGCGKLYIKTENIILDKKFTGPHHTRSGKYIKISVTDTGSGIDEAILKNIFDPFFTTKNEQGTGLGLASAYEIIKNHGGIITARSKKNQGTTFNIYLPAFKKTVIEEKEIVQRVFKSQETILLVDDEEMIIKVARQMLEELGYSVLIAESGKKAVEIISNGYGKEVVEKDIKADYAESGKPVVDLVILDLIMPDMRGDEIYKKIRKIEPDLKVLLSSGYGMDQMVSGLLKDGCNGFIQKPFSINDLSCKIRTIFDSFSQ